MPGCGQSDCGGIRRQGRQICGRYGEPAVVATRLTARGRISKSNNVRTYGSAVACAGMCVPDDFAHIVARAMDEHLDLLQWSRVLLSYYMVEAGGVEPPSEKARNEENYVRSRFMSFGCRFRTGKSGGHLVRLISAVRLRTEAFGLSRKMTLTHRRAGSPAGAAT